MAFFTISTIVSLLAVQGVRAADGETGTAYTSSYFDCCKPDCAWEGQANYLTPVLTCDANDNPLTDPTAVSFCDDGDATACTDQTPWAVNDTFSYGFASIFIKGAELKSWCCTCYELEFLDSTIKGKKMIVQGVNTNYNEEQKNYFSLTLPGQADWKGACVKRFNGTYSNFFNKGGASFVSIDQCEDVPESVRPACEWRYGWYENANAANVTFRRVQCPKDLVDKTGCFREDDAEFVASEAPSPSGTETASSSDNTAPSFAAGPNSASLVSSLSVTLAVWALIFMVAH